MIKIKITKGKLASMVISITSLTQKLRADIHNMKYDMARASTNAHLYVLDDLSRKMRSKLILLEDKPSIHQLYFSINEIQALVIIIHKQNISHNPYSMAVMHEISDMIFKKLLG